MSTTPRAAIYARFSSDLQRDASIDDQIRSCRDYAARQGLEAVEVYSDRACPARAWCGAGSRSSFGMRRPTPSTS